MIEEKVKKAFCPPKVVKDNPVIDYSEHVVLPAMGSLEVKRPARYCGPIEISGPSELRKMYAAGKLHPADLKAAVAGHRALGTPQAIF